MLRTSPTPDRLTRAEQRVLDAVRRLGIQSMVRPIADEACVGASTALQALRRLRDRRLVNLHYAHILGRQQLRWIVPVELGRPRTL
jgi:hypothetical protein